MRNKLNLLLMLAVLFAAFGAHAAQTPEEQLAAFQIHPELEVTCWASDPMIANPIQTAFDPQGRLWVICSYAYPQILPGQDPPDKLIVLEDTDKDGKADKRTIFADNLLMPTGFELGDGGVYIANQPDLLFLKDNDGDMVADERRVLLSGFGTEDNHHAISAWRWSPGGFLYFQSGIFLHTQVETPWGVVRLNDGGIFEYEPRKQRLEVYVHQNFANPWGHVFDKWGQNFLTEAPGGGIFYLLPGQVDTELSGGYPGIPGPPKSCGVEFVSGDHFPPDWQDDLILNAFKTKIVCRYKMSDDGSGYAARELDPLIVSTEDSFRPVDVKMGPDGALYIADWYNPIIGHMQYNFRDPRRDKEHGRIWRVAYKGRPTVEPPVYEGKQPTEILDYLKSSAEFNRHQARRFLYDQNAEEVSAALGEWIQKLDENEPEFEHHRLEALWTSQTIGRVDIPLLETLLASKDYRVRAAALRVLRDCRHQIEDPLADIEALIHDEHPRVRLEAVVACSYLPSDRAVDIAMRVLDLPMDRYLDFALRNLVKALSDHWFPRLESGEMVFEGKPDRIGFALQSAGSKGVVKPLLEMIQTGKVPAEKESSVLGLIASVGSAEELGELLDPDLFRAFQTEPATPLTGWKLAGTFPYDKDKDMEEQAYGPEKEPFNAEAQFPLEGKEAVTWKDAEEKSDGTVLIHENFRKTDRTVTYAYSTVECDEPIWAVYEVRRDDGIEIFVNGEKAYSSPSSRHLTSDPYYVTLALNPGVNGMLLKVNDLGAPTGFRLTRTGSRKGPIDTSLQARIYATLNKAARDRGVQPEGDLSQIGENLHHADAALALQSVRLTGAWKIENLRPELEHIAADESRPMSHRIAAVKSLADLGGDPSRSWLAAYADKGAAAEKHLAAVGLVPIDATGAAPIAAQALASSDAAWTEEQLESLVLAFMERKGALDLLTSALSGAVIPPDAAKQTLRVLIKRGVQQPELTKLIQSAAQVDRFAEGELSPEAMEALMKEIVEKGDPHAGEAVFHRADLACLQCHAILGGGGLVGPDLAGLGASSQLDYLVDSILHPSKAIRENYDAVLVETVDGEMIHGIKLRDTEEALFLRDAINAEIKIPQEDIIEERDTGSMMPEGLADLLTRKEFIDLVAFTYQLGRPGDFSTPNTPVVRTWRVLDAVPAKLASTAPDNLTEADLSEAGLLWRAEYSRVSGALAPESMKAGDSNVAFVKCTVEVTTPGSVEFALNTAAGLSLWLNGKPVEVQKALRVDLDRGLQTLVFRVDLDQRGAEGLRVEINEVPGSAGRALVVSGR